MNQATQYQRDDVMQRWADLPEKRREKLSYRFGHLLERLFARLGLVCMCTDCLRVLTYEQYMDNGHCPFCGRSDVVTPYEC